MPNIKSAEKRVKVTQTKQLRNRMIKSNIKTTLKKFDASDASAKQEMLSGAVSAVDKAAAKGIIHKKAANRKKAQLAKKLAAN